MFVLSCSSGRGRDYHRAFRPERKLHSDYFRLKLYFMSIDPRRLVVLRAVDRYGGVVGAAAALRLSPSAVSQQLATLERETGFGLVDRSRRGGQRSIEFTTAGRRLVAHADSLVQVLDDAEAELNALADAVSGPVTLAAFVTALRGFAGTAIVELAHQHPGLDLSVHQLERPDRRRRRAGRTHRPGPGRGRCAAPPPGGARAAIRAAVRRPVPRRRPGRLARVRRPRNGGRAPVDRRAAATARSVRPCAGCGRPAR